MELRDAVISAVCARNFDLLPGLVQKLARLSPTKDVLRGNGIGHWLAMGTFGASWGTPPRGEQQLYRRVGAWQSGKQRPPELQPPKPQLNPSVV